MGVGYLRPVLDIETNSSNTKAQVSDYVNRFVNTIVAAKGPRAQPIIYTSVSFANDYLNTSVTSSPLWLARLGGGRRAFGLRWSSKLMPADLQQRTRHEDIGTTMKYYVGQNAEAVADAVWASVGNSRGNTADRQDSDHEEKTAITVGMTGVEPALR
jgi:hypothetical protein